VAVRGSDPGTGDGREVTQSQTRELDAEVGCGGYNRL